MVDNKHIKHIFSAVFALATLLFLGICYPYHLHFQEQSQLFEWTGKYLLDVVGVPGGFADWCGRFLTQFCHISWLGALIIAGLLALMQRLTAKVASANGPIGYALSLIPAILALLFLLDEKALLGGIVAIVLCLAAALPIRAINSKFAGTAAAVLCTPLMYWLCGPMAIVLVVACCLRKGAGIVAPLAAAAVLVTCPFILENQLHCTLKDLLQGVHYYRYLGDFPTMLWITAGAVALYVVLCSFIKESRSGSVAKGAIVAAAIIIAGGVGVAFTGRFDDETIMHYDYLAMTEQWDEIIALSHRKEADKPASVCCVNLALAKKGTIGDHLFDQPQGGTAGLFPKFAKTAINPLPTSEVFWQLGMVNMSQYYTFEAQEAAGDFQKSSRCYKRLAQTNIVNRDYDVARKYLSALGHTLFYRGWAKKNIKMLGDETSVESDPIYGKMRSFRSHGKDEIYSEDRIDVLLGYLVEENPSNTLAMDYLLCYELLDNNLNNFWYYLQNYKGDKLPRFYQEGVMMLWVDKGMPLQSMPGYISEANIKRLQSFIHDNQAGMSEEKLRTKYGNSFMFHALFN